MIIKRKTIFEFRNYDVKTRDQIKVGLRPFTYIIDYWRFLSYKCRRRSIPFTFWRCGARKWLKNYHLVRVFWRKLSFHVKVIVCKLALVWIYETFENDIHESHVGRMAAAASVRRQFLIYNSSFTPWWRPGGIWAWKTANWNRAWHESWTSSPWSNEMKKMSAQALVLQCSVYSITILFY